MSNLGLANMIYDYIQKYPFKNDFKLLSCNKSERGIILLEVFILYKNNLLHRIKLVYDDSSLFWHMIPYNNAYLLMEAYDMDSFNAIIKAIEEHTELHLMNNLFK